MTQRASAATLIERAAAAYGFEEALRAPAVSPDVAPMPAPVVRLRPERRPLPGAIAIDRERLAAGGYVPPEGASGPLAEQVRLVKRGLLRAMAARPEAPRSVLVTSAQAGDGKTFSAVNLGLSLAGEQDLEVLLVDGDFAKPELAGLFGMLPEPGFIDAVADERFDVEQAVVATDVPGLSLLAAGRDAVNVTELLASSRTAAVIRRLLESRPNRVVLFDTAPALASSQAAALAAHVGHALLVVRADRTSESDLRQATKLLSACPNLSAMLNGATLPAAGRSLGRYLGGSS